MNAATIFVAVVLGVVFGLPQSFERQSDDLITLNSVVKSHNLGIYDGNTTTMNTHRYLVGILSSGSFLCAGVIVSKTWIVTLADCTASVSDITELTIVSSSSDGVTGRNYSVIQVVPHPDYGTATLDYDFSCIQVNGTFYYGNRRAHMLPLSEPKDNSTVMVAGYGCTTEKCGERALRKASMTWLPKSTCNSTYSKYKITDWSRLGCLYNSEGATLCKGDFGDPIIKGQVFYGMFASALSTGFCSSSASPVIVTDVYPVADWIRNVTGAK